MATENYYFPVYFNDWDAIREAVTPEQGWIIFTRCLDYAMGRSLPLETDPVITAFFKLISGGIDRGTAKAAMKSKQARYARYCGICKKQGDNPLPFDEWASTVDATQRTLTDVNGCQRTLTDVNNHNRNQESKIKNTKIAKRESDKDVGIHNRRASNIDGLRIGIVSPNGCVWAQDKSCSGLPIRQVYRRY